MTLTYYYLIHSHVPANYAMHPYHIYLVEGRVFVYTDDTVKKNDNEENCNSE